MLRRGVKAVKSLHRPLIVRLLFNVRAFSGSPWEDDTRFTTVNRNDRSLSSMPRIEEAEPLHVLEHRLNEKLWHTYATMLVESRAQGNKRRGEELAFLALAFREFDLDKNNVLDADEFRAALCSPYLSLDNDVVDKCFESMDVNADGKIQLDEWYFVFSGHLAFVHTSSMQPQDFFNFLMVD